MTRFHPYTYHHVEVVRVIDGDTVRVSIDVGFRFRTEQTLRLLDLDTPERGQPGFREASDKLREVLNSGPIVVQTVKQDSFGRWLAHMGAGGSDVGATMRAWLQGVGL